MSIPHYRMGAYYAFLQTTRHEAIDFVLRLVNFASARATELLDARHIGRLGSVTCPFGTGNMWLGGENAFTWNRGIITSCERAVAPLVALEKWLVDRVELGHSIDA